MSAEPPKRPPAAKKKAVKKAAPSNPLRTTSSAELNGAYSREAVQKVQQALANHEFFKGTMDGIWGPQTQRAILMFQNANGLSETGELDDDTVQLLLNNTAKEQPPLSKQETSTQNYWLLKLSKWWDPEQLQPGVRCYFHTHRGQNRRPEYKGNLDKVQPGERIIGFNMEHQMHTHTFVVDRGIHQDPELGEIITFHVEEVLPQPVPASSFQHNSQQYDHLVNDNGVRLFLNQKELFFETLRMGGSQTAAKNTESIATVNSDTLDPSQKIILPSYATEGNHRQTEDKLGFEHDYQSLATVMAMSSVNPPLAIGLFGNWGSGKSFFMEKLHGAVEKLSRLQNDAFVQHVVQVRFNSWHYADTNLWASLVSEIFHELHRYAKTENKEDELHRLQQTLNLAKGQKEAAAANQKNLEATVAQLEAQKEERRRRLEDLTGIGLIKLALSNKHVKEDLKFLKNEQVEAIVADTGEIKKTVAEAQSLRYKVAASWKLFQQAKGWRWGIFLLVALAVFAASILATGVYKAFFQNELLPVLGMIASGGAAIVKYLWSYLKPAVQGINKGAERLNSLLQTANDRPQEATPELDAKRTDLDRLQAEIVCLDKEINATQKHIDEIVSGARLFSFLEQRTIDENYSKQLGLISLIRKDFGRLDELLRMQFVPQGGQAVHNPLKVHLQIDRIVLYIDDLDRCNADTVVKVLEAIHLLLAFPLFVVVVGVDPRWLNNALNEKYQVLFGGKQSSEMGSTNGFAATSYDYLEKIFQIPFCLKPINDTGRESLIEYLVQGEVALKEVSEREEENEEKEAETKNGAPVTPNFGQEATAASTTEVPSTVLASEIKGQKATAITVKLLTDRISFSEDELKLMKRLSAIYATSPRTINRFVNIYRIIKSHQSLSTTGLFSSDDFGPVLVILSVVVGYSGHAHDFIAKLKGAPKDQSFVDFLKSASLDLRLEESVKNCLSDELRNFPCSQYQNNMELISRFSFRTLV